ncbi:hypothetical protein [Deinococcus arenicola]|uniref:Uncharacterized protein n=1 Tax=Deinococcus arenicola TaxID=2994950 RepID=A0ABU4DP17_9DEIO|nr:hypothetical protein [Deinococcus sp. ZS9-10]MDV6373844.1 hypothetical protein [Deinococcus sp. ZS9-10]
MVQSALQLLKNALDSLLGLSVGIVLGTLLLALLLVGLLDCARFQAGLDWRRGRSAVQNGEG